MSKNEQVNLNEAGMAAENLKRAISAEKRLETCRRTRQHDTDVLRSDIRQLKNKLAVADDLIKSYRASLEAGAAADIASLRRQNKKLLTQLDRMTAAAASAQTLIEILTGKAVTND